MPRKPTSRGTPAAALLANGLSRHGRHCPCPYCREAVPPVLVSHQLIPHAVHYMYDHPARGHDLEQWVIEAPVQPLWSKLKELGLPEDARWDAGHAVDGRQRWTYTAQREMSPGACERCERES